MAVKTETLMERDQKSAHQEYAGLDSLPLYIKRLFLKLTRSIAVASHPDDQVAIPHPAIADENTDPRK